MGRGRILVWAVPLVVLFSPSAIFAQDHYSPVRILPTVGIHAPLGELRRVYDDTLLSVRASGGAVYGLAIEYDRMLQELDLRLGIAYVPGLRLVARGAAGRVICDARCEEPVFHGPRATIGRSALLMATADFVLRPIPASAMRTWKPYALFGGGIRYQDFAQDGLAAVARHTFANDEWGGVAQLGAGVDAHLGGAVVTAELSDYLSIQEYTAKLYDRSTGGEVQRRDGALHHDVIAALGLRFGPFW